MPGRWLRSKPSLAECRLRRQCREYSSQTPFAVLRGSALGPVRENEHQTLRIRKDVSAKDLPLPPVLDTVVLEKVNRWISPKKKPDLKHLSPFQQKLLENPYAHALASPARICRSTGASLPSAFLTTLHIRPHPKTGDPWLLPMNLTTEKKPLGPTFHLVNRKLAIDEMGKTKNWMKFNYTRTNNKLDIDSMHKSVWRRGMPELIISLKQKALMKKLHWNFKEQGRLTPVAGPRSEDLDGVEDVSCVLLFRSLRTRADDLNDRANAFKLEADQWAAYIAKQYRKQLDPHQSKKITHHRPQWYRGPIVHRLQHRILYPELEFPTTYWQGRKVPLYSLADLLGQENVASLVKATPYEGETCAVMKRARHNVSTEMMLMQLQEFIAKSAPVHRL